MFSVIFPGQGSQIVQMGKEFYEKFDLVKNLFKKLMMYTKYVVVKIYFKWTKIKN